ncbi:hypothetical protein F4778DRAFT_479658 [Xylariomycetidae sp. FL2044]|nr:hypothetical protein F4778DRAFT_479658 [Xylariomycetidae sp. FL2044]
MFPPVDSSVLTNNPEFGQLYNTLVTTVLNPDASTRDEALEQKRERVRNQLKDQRFVCAKHHLVVNAIRATLPDELHSAHQSSMDEMPPARRQRYRNSGHNQLPDSLLDLLLVMPGFFSRARDAPDTLSRDTMLKLLTNPPFVDLAQNYTLLTTELSATLTKQANQLARVVNPRTNPSYIHRTVSDLPTSTTTLQSALQVNATQLSSARLRAASSLTMHLGQHTLSLLALIKALELKHGAQAKHTSLNAEIVGLEAQTWALAVEALLKETVAAVYPDAARTALRNYQRHLGDARMRIADGVRVRENELADYGVVVSDSGGGTGGAMGNKEKTMREMAKVWREMEMRLQEVKGDLSRLS